MSSYFLSLLFFVFILGCGNDHQACEDCQPEATPKATVENLQTADFVPVQAKSSVVPLGSEAEDQILAELENSGTTIGTDIAAFHKQYRQKIDDDLEFLITKIDSFEAFKTEVFQEKIIKRLSRDDDYAKTAWQTLKETKHPIGSYTSMRKLAYSLYSTNSSKIIPGLLPDALSLFQYMIRQNLMNQKGVLHLKKTLSHNNLTTLKTLLLYLTALQEDVNTLSDLTWKAELLDPNNVQMLYPTPLYSTVLERPEIKNFTLRLDQQMIYPNSGYVYGGNPISGVCRGVDCSSLIKFLFDLNGRTTTLTLAKSAQMIIDATKANVTPFSSEPVVQEVIEKFEVIDFPSNPQSVSLDDLKTGDILDWSTSYGGHKSHVVMFIKKLSDQEYLTFEANRFDDKSSEGIFFNKLTLSDSPLSYVLRYKN